jgi:dehydratase
MATHRGLMVLGVAVLPLLLPTGADAAPTASYACRADTKFGRHRVSVR